MGIFRIRLVVVPLIMLKHHGAAVVSNGMVSIMMAV
jgi:hypothetical protein